MMATSNRTCTFDGCGLATRTKGLCTAHYTQHLRGETLRPRRTVIDGLDERVDARTIKTDGCWQWQGAHANTGYAQVRFNKELLYVHRVMFERVHGPIPQGRVIDHICHNRGCINPAHLEAVTSKQNNENRAGAAAHSLTGIRGVSYDPRRQKWYGRVNNQGTRHWLGYFDSIEEATWATRRKRAEVFTNSRLDSDPAAYGDND